MITACTECGGKVSDKAGACPHCGAPVEKAAERKPLPEGGDPLPPKEAQGSPVAVVSRQEQAVPAEQPSSEPKGQPVGNGWFVLIPGKSDLLGPVDDAGVIKLIAEGTTRGNSSLRRENSKEWTDLKDLPQFSLPLKKADLERGEVEKWGSGSRQASYEMDLEDRSMNPGLNVSDLLTNPAVAIAVLAMLGGMIGLFVSQCVPIFGGIETMGQPWSQARQGLIGTHVVLFVVIGGAAGWFVSRKMKQ